MLNITELNFQQLMAWLCVRAFVCVRELTSMTHYDLVLYLWCTRGHEALLCLRGGEFERACVCVHVNGCLRMCALMRQKERIRMHVQSMSTSLILLFLNQHLDVSMAF